MEFKPEVIQITTTKERLESWKLGERTDCSDEYLRKVGVTQKTAAGFNEYLAGKYFEQQGFQYLHRYTLFGTKKVGTFQDADEVLKSLLGEEAYLKLFEMKSLFPKLRYELPDILYYNLETKQFGFAEAKRNDPKDIVRAPQLKGLALVHILLNAPVCIIEIAVNEQQNTDVVTSQKVVQSI